MRNLDSQSEAIAIVSNYIRSKGYRHGPVIQTRPINSTENKIWEVELAHFGEVGPSETCDPASMSYRVNLITREVSLLDLM